MELFKYSRLMMSQVIVGYSFVDRVKSTPVNWNRNIEWSTGVNGDTLFIMSYWMYGNHITFGNYLCCIVCDLTRTIQRKKDHSQEPQY